MNFYKQTITSSRKSAQKRGKMNADPRGVLRGGCTCCPCGGYTRKSNEVKCSSCGHPPSKHANLSTAASAGGAQYSQYSGPHVSPSYAGSGFGAPVQHASYYPQVTPTPSLDLPQCLDPDCDNEVHYDRELGPFDYCSPECRDRHLLPKEREKLKADIAKFSSDISSLPPFVQPSYEASHDVKGPDANDCMELKKKAKEDLGILVGKDLKGGLLITGVKVKSPAFKYFQKDSVRFLDVIMEVNEELVTTPEAFQENVRSKTLPRLKLKRCYNMPSPKNFMAEVEAMCPSVTHIFVLSPQCTCVGSEQKFGFVPSSSYQGVKISILAPLTSCAYLSGVVENDVIKMYALVHNMTVGTAKKPRQLYPTLTGHDEFEQDMKTAAREQKAVILAVQRYA